MRVDALRCAARRFLLSFANCNYFPVIFGVIRQFPVACIAGQGNLPFRCCSTHDTKTITEVSRVALLMACRFERFVVLAAVRTG